MTQASVQYTLPKELEGTILASIMHAKLPEIAGAKQKWPAASIQMMLDRAPEVRSLKGALLRRSPSIIGEIKKASPSAGLLRRDFDPVAIALEYEKAGAAAISVVSEGKHFQGRLETIADLRWRTALPLLRKDFIVDSYQVFESRHAGADAILLITALLTPSLLRSLRAQAEDLGMDALVEVHDESELERAVESGATLIGVNNRDLRTFEVSPDRSLGLAARIPRDVVAVSESGIRTAEDVRKLANAGYRGFLVGETLMRVTSPGAALAELVHAVEPARGRSR
jgi:indole-3-glycerol phosphate synthase